MGADDSVELPIDRFIEKVDQLEEKLTNGLSSKVEDALETCQENNREIKKVRNKQDERQETIRAHQEFIEQFDEDTVEALQVVGDAFNGLKDGIVLWLKRIFWFAVFAFLTSWLFPSLGESIPWAQFLQFLKATGL